MNKIQKIIFISSALLILILLVLLLTKKNNSGNTENNSNNNNIYNNPSQPVANPTTLSTYKIIAVSPSDEEKNVPQNSFIQITFNLPPGEGNEEFTVAPAFEFTSELNNNQLTVTPLSLLAEGTKYTYIVKFKNQILPSRTYTFTTTGEFSILPDTQPSGAAEFEENFQKENHPDVFLSNFTPYSADSFSVSSEFIPVQPGHFRFTVTSLSSSGRQDFHDWLRSLDFTDSRISALDILYM